MAKVVKKHYFAFNPKDNGGETFFVISKIYKHNDTEPMYTTHEVTLMSYCNCASFFLQGAQITPTALRKFADELEVAIKEAADIKFEESSAKDE